VLPASLTLTIAPGSEDNNSKVPTTAWVRALISSLGYVTLASDQTITGLKTIVRSGDVLNFKIGTDTLYGLKVAYNQNELVPSGEATWSFVNTFNRNGTGFSVTPISFFRGVLVTGERLLSASVNANLLDYYSNNPSGRYPVYAYNTGVQQFSTGIIVGKTTGVVNAATGAISDLPSGVVANFGGRVIGSNAVNSNEFVTLTQLDSYVPTSRTLTINGTTFDLSANRTWTIPAGVTSFNTRTGAITLSSGDVTGALGYTPYNSTNPSGYTSNLGTVTSVSGTGTVSGLTLSGTVSSSGNITLGGTLSLTSGNVTSALGYTPVQPNGTGASGTWGISITGNATYSLNSTRLYASDAPYTYGGAAPYYMTMTYDGSRWLLQVTPGTPAAVRVAYADNSGTTSQTNFSDLSITGAAHKYLTINPGNGYEAMVRYIGGSGSSWYVGKRTATEGGIGTGDFHFYAEASARTVVGINSSGYIYAHGYHGNQNVAGTGAASHHPSGIYSTGTNWLYGTMYLNNSAIWDAANIYNNGWYRNVGQNGLYSQTYDNHFASYDTNYWRIASGSGLEFWSKGISAIKGYIYFDGSTFGLLNSSGQWAVRTYGSSETQLMFNGSWRGIAQSNGFRVNGNLYTDVDYGYGLVGVYTSTRYQGVFAMGDAYKLAADGSSTGSLYGLAWSHPNTGGVAANLNTHGLLVMEAGGFLAAISGSIRSRDDMRTPIFYDQNDTSYYADFNSTSNSAMRIRGGALFGPNPTWGRYLQVGGNGNQNTDYASVVTTDGNLHLDSRAGNSMYLNYYANGTIYLNGSTYYISSNGANYNGTSANSSSLGGYGSSSYLGQFGNSYYQVNTWLQMNGTHGMYWPSYYSAHIYANASSTYTQLRFDGAKNSYSGVYLGDSAVNGMMYDSGGNGGVYREANGRWYFYYHLGNDCMGVGTSSTSSTYSLYLNKGIYAPSRIDATIFYDASNTGYYLDPNGGSYLASSLEIANGYFLTNGVGGSMRMSSVQGSFGGYFQFAQHAVIETIVGGYHVYVLSANGNGVVKYDGAQSWSAHSDRRIKTIHSLMENNLSKLESINPIYYSFNNFADDKNRIGLVAQEVQEHFPELVTLDPKTDYLTLDYTGLIPVLLGAIKELKNKVEVLESQL